MKTANYTLIPMSDIKDEPRKIAIAWHEAATDWIGDKHKLASDIQNYAESYAIQVAEAVRDEIEDKISDYLEQPETAVDDFFQQGIKRALTELRKIDLTTFIK